MQVVGVDFGTTNVRIATWDSEQAAPPQPQPISILGSAGEPIMPAVVALQNQPNGEVAIIVGEDAEGMIDEEGITRVIPNIKRLALSTDSYVNWHLQFRSAHEETESWPPQWWDPERLCIKEFGREFPVWELIGAILTEAFRRAGISGDYEWRAGCPVHSDFLYRKGLTDTLTQVTGKTGSPQWIVEEPFLFLLAFRVIGDLPQGSYLVYDVGGGSFDCAVVEIAGDKTQIYGADGHPKLGGSDIDAWLDQALRKQGYRAQFSLLRQAKETLNEVTPYVKLQEGPFITLDYANASNDVKSFLAGETVVDFKTALTEPRFLEKSESVFRDAYIGAKSLWWTRPYKEEIPIPEGAIRYPPAGEVLYERYKIHSSQDREVREVRFVWQLMLPDLVADVAKVILCGGPTKSWFFPEYLAKSFPTEKIVAASDLMPGIVNPELTGASVGACYSAKFSASYREYTPLYVNRLPLQITLEDLQTGEKAEYQPFQHFTAPRTEQGESQEVVSGKYEPFADFVSPKTLSENSDDPISLSRYELTVTDIDGTVLERRFIDNQLNTRLLGAKRKLVIDRYHRVLVAEWSDKSGVSLQPVLDDMPGKTDEQKDAYAALEYQRAEDVARRNARIQAELDAHRHDREWGQAPVL